MENTETKKRGGVGDDYLLPNLPELFECFISNSEKFFSFLKDDYMFNDISGVYHFEYNPAKLIAIDYEMLKGRRFVVVGREFYDKECRIEMLYGTLGLNGTGDEGIHLNVRYQTEKNCFKISDVLQEAGVLEDDLNMKNIESCESLIKTLKKMGDYIKNNISLFTTKDNKVLKKMAKKQNIMKKEALKKYYEEFPTP